MHRQTHLRSPARATPQTLTTRSPLRGAPWARALGLAALATVSMATQAQSTGNSSLTLYGLVDASVGRFTGAATGVNAQNKAVSKMEGGSL